jgi:hypothetical protein
MSAARNIYGASAPSVSLFLLPPLLIGIYNSNLKPLYFKPADVMFRENQVFWHAMLRLQNNFTLFERPQRLRLQGLEPFFQLPGRVLHLKGETSCLLYVSRKARFLCPISYRTENTGIGSVSFGLSKFNSRILIHVLSLTYVHSRQYATYFD